MSTFSSAVINQEARTSNGMKARKSSANACIDLFYAIGGSRGKDIIPLFSAAFVENQELAIRIALWARDVRGGAGERELFRNIIKFLELNNLDVLKKILPLIPEIGRIDDLLVFDTNEAETEAYNIIAKELVKGNKLVYKWLPREKSINKFFESESDKKLSYADKLAKLNPNQKRKYLSAKKLQKYLELSERQYRKLLAGNTEVVETLMCAKKFNDIDFGKIPSLAHTRYKKAFIRNALENYTKYTKALESGAAKINAGAVYPYDVIKTLKTNAGEVEKGVIKAQWDALENFVGDANILPVVDVSGSMCCPVGGNRKSVLECIDVAVSMGLYLAEKNKGVFRNVFCTFSSKPALSVLKGDIVQKYNQLVKSDWGMGTDLHKVFELILKLALDASVPEEEMPKYIIIFSDMQFNGCASYDDSAIEMIRRKYSESGYSMPGVIFWNLNDYSNVPVKFSENGVALVSGFSPSLLKSILKLNLDKLTPENMMLETIMNPRYNWN